MSHHVRNSSFWLEFFRLYRSMPELWLANSKDYRNRRLKDQSYDRLLSHLREADPTSNIHMLKRKINNLRTSYRRELRKVIESKSQGPGEEYVPSLWYFNELDFLYDEETDEAQTLSNPQRENVYQDVTQCMSEVQAEDNVMENAPIVLDEDIFAEPYQPEEDMLIIAGEPEAEPEGGEGEGEGEAEPEAEDDADDCAIVDVDLDEGGEEDDEEPEMEDTFDDEEQVNEVYLKNFLLVGANCQIKAGKANGNNINNSNIIKRAYSRPQSHSYGTNQYTLLSHSQSQSRHRNNNNNTDVSRAQVQTLRRGSRRRSSSAALDDYNESSAAAAAMSRPTPNKKRHILMPDDLLNLSVEDAENECDLIGKRIAAHFRNMRADQRLFAERIISEVLVFGRMNRLSLDARFLPNGSLTTNNTATQNINTNTNTDAGSKNNISAADIK